MQAAEITAADLPPLPTRRGFAKWYSQPVVQVCLIAMVCFLCPGMYNALSGIGGGGQVDPKASNDGSVALYSTFAATSFFSGTLCNRLGARLTLGVGAAGYALYIGAFLSYNINQNSGFVVAAGALLGVCAGMLWTAQGSMTLAYATESTKGRLFALFWMIFNMGAVLGSAIELGLTYDSEASTVSNSVYAAFLAIAAIGAFIPLILVSPGLMVRVDGTRVVVPVHPSWKTEIVGLYRCLRYNVWIILLFPYFLSSNWFYTWQFNSYNGALFTLRTRSLNSMLYWLFQVFASLAFGVAIDSTRFRRVNRAWGGLVFVTALCMAVWGAAYHFQKGYTRADLAEPRAAEFARIDFKDAGYANHVVLYIFMGIMDAIWQNFAYWLMGAMSNDASQLAYLVGFYKAIQSAGAAGVFRMDSNLAPYMTELAVSWGLNAAGILFVIPVILLRVTDRTDEAVVTADEVPTVVASSALEKEGSLDEKKGSMA
ncbi:major facilitator superfamily domain-containing protein [Leucosporidium creatinivorum]|uniref:Major facilitator superfamily domain-containing protein n=1 Tax=Leucosporidium creatinivorum TaxID=106004 RepID=A0A1Y2FPY1_9BASI|nr:major facilitator superfamily domain-containing protein [Leucosporidium creatinivorum]